MHRPPFALLLVSLTACQGALPAPEAGVDAPSNDVPALGDDAPGDDAPALDSPGDAPTEGDGGLRCREDVDCDDGNPATTEMCLTVGAPDGLGWCLVLECYSDADCDDGSPVTYDRCLLDDVSFTSTCEHDRLPNRCELSADCLTADGLHGPAPACVSADCDARGLCAYDWTDGCEIEAFTEALTTCASAGAVEGAICCDGPTCVSPCLLSGAGTACRTTLVCAGVPGRYQRVTPAGPDCPSTTCPSLTPAHDDVCTGASRCDYGRHDLIASERAPSEHLEDGPSCTCLDGRWSCVGDPCPARPPTDGATAAIPAWHRGAAICDYLGRRCIAGAGTPWHCITPLLCPATAPTAGEACLPDADEHCSFQRDVPSEPVTTYTGTCSCQASGVWSCEPSRSAACPVTRPADGSTCEPVVGNGECTYGDELARCRCETVAPGLPGRWTCP